MFSNTILKFIAIIILISAGILYFFGNNRNNDSLLKDNQLKNQINQIKDNKDSIESQKSIKLNEKVVKNMKNNFNQVIENKENSAIVKISNEFVGIWHMKLINETITDEELENLHKAGFSVLGGEWGMVDLSIDDFLKFLDRVHKYKMNFIVNFSDGAAWGYKDDGFDSRNLEPVWQEEKIKKYLEKIKNHPAVYGYDISNEAGENLPNGYRYRISLAQMKKAAMTVRAIDNKKPIIIRMHYWDDEDGDFTWQNPFASGIADIVILNLYSNYSVDKKNSLLPQMIKNSAQKLIDKILTVDPHVDIWISLAAFAEDPYFLKPAKEDLLRDIKATKRLRHVKSIGFFGFGPERYSNDGKNWYLMRDGQELWAIIKQEINN